MALFDQILSPLLDQATKIISEFHASPEEKQAAIEKMEQLRQQSVDSSRNYEVQLNTIAGQNIRADAESQDRFTQRARPLFMYIIEFILAFNYIGTPIYAMVTGKSLAPVQLPADLLTLFGVCVTGYVFARTAEKVSGMSGDSEINVLGMKIANKS
jgi:hypothetical protein